jgi:ABC-type transport system involved in cytochrome c biogenesis permease subunit
MRTLAYAGAAVFYLAASILYLRSFVRARPGSSRAVSALIFAGVLLHATGVALYWLHFREPPLVGLGPSLVSLSLLIALALLGLEMYSSAGAIALLLSPVALLLLLSALLAGIEPAGSATAFRGPWLALHASLGFVGYASWMVAAASGLMYLFQFRELKDKRLGAVFRFFPALEILDRLGRRSLITGFFALTLGIILGVAWVLRFDPEVLRGEPKVIWGLGSWGVMSVVLWLRLGGRRTGREAAFWSVAGFALVFLTYLAAKLLAPETRFFL